MTSKMRAAPGSQLACREGAGPSVSGVCSSSWFLLKPLAVAWLCLGSSSVPTGARRLVRVRQPADRGLSHATIVEDFGLRGVARGSSRQCHQ